MAMPVSVSKPIAGVDVAKNELVIYHAELDLLETIPNNKAAIKQWLKDLPRTVAIAIESTNIYHLEFADLAYEAGCVIYMVGGYELSHYRKGGECPRQNRRAGCQAARSLPEERR